MESLFEIIIALVVIVFSVLWDKGKTKPANGGTDDATDLEAIEEFFKKQSNNLPASTSSLSTKPSSPSSWSTNRDPCTEFQSLESSASLENVELGSLGSYAPPPPPPPVSRSSQKPHKEKRKDKAKPGLSSLQQEKKGALTPGRDGQAGLDRQMSAFSRSLAAPDSSSHLPRASHKQWSRQRFLDALVLSEVMTRYDINRLFARVPQRRD
jgi:hypothetical protein